MLGVSRMGPDRVVANQLGQEFKQVFGPNEDSVVQFGNVEFGDNISPIASFAFTRRNAFSVKGEVSLTTLTEALFSMRIASEMSAYVVDGDGTVFADRNYARALRKERTKVFEDAERGIGRLVVGALPAGAWLSGPDAARSSMVTSVSIQGTSWRLVFQRPLTAALRPVWSNLASVLAFAILGLLLAVVLSKWLAGRIATPIIELSRAAQRLAQGDFSTRVRALPTHELSSLGIAFNQMALEIESFYASMEQKVAERTSEADAANRHKSDFLAHMSHELRTPLNAVIGFSEMLKAQYFGALNDKQAEYVRDINASGQHLLSLINDILDLAKVEAGRMELVRSEVHLPSLVEACCSLVSERFARKSQTLNAVVDPVVSFWSLDERKVKQCVLNLLSNANKFTPSGGRVSLSVAVEDNALMVRVTDTGVGIAPEALTNLFTEFYQVAPSSAAAGGAATAQSTDAREGTGLGLALTKKFVELHGGTVEVASEVGKGSTFTLRFPAITEPDAAPAVAS